MTVVILSDLHTGHRTGLCPLEVDTGDGSGYKSTPQQRTMYYRAWLPLVEKILKLRDFVLVLNGDLGDYDVKKRGMPLISTNPNALLMASFDLLFPLVEASRKTVILRGTDAHVGTNGAHEETLAIALDKRYPGKIHPAEGKTLTHPHVTAEIDGLRYDIAHHTEASPGKAQTTRATFPVRVGVAVYNRYREAGEKLPDVIVRGHNHYPAQADYKGMRILCLPGWQWPTEYVYRIGGAEIIASFGGAIGNELETYHIRRRGIWQKL